MTGGAAVVSKTGRLLGLDVGDRWLGLAISDPEQRLALPLRVIDRKQGDVLAVLTQLAAAEEVTALVVGLPLNMSGDAGPQAEKARAFAEAVAARLGRPAVLWDERLSTWQAAQMTPPRRRGQRRRRDDAAAAAVILQSYLDQRQRS
jgi:putative Holliday junction resolvase